MKNKILGLPKAAVIVIGIVITALFLVLMNLVGAAARHVHNHHGQLSRYSLLLRSAWQLDANPVCCFLQDTSSHLEKPAWAFSGEFILEDLW